MLTLWGCACGSNRSVYLGNTTPPQTQRPVYETAEPDSLEPASSLLTEYIFVIPALFEGLTTLNPVTLEPMAGLATHYEVNSNTTRFTFYLRGHASPRSMKLPTLDDPRADLRLGHRATAAHIPAYWSDGLTITADDFAYSWKRVLLQAMPILPLSHDVQPKLRESFLKRLGSNLLNPEQFKYAWIDTNWRPQ